MGSRLEHVIARNVAELRAAEDETQQGLAERMRAAGFRWQSNRVAQVETLHRPVSLLEVVGLSRVFNVPVVRLLSGDDLIDLPSGAAIPLAAVRDALAGKPGKTEIGPLTPEQSAQDGESVEDLGRVSRGLGLEVKDLQALSYRLWGRSFHAERDRSLGDVSGLNKRSVQTKRGHVTRELVKDVRAWMERNPDQLTPDALERVRSESSDAILSQAAVLADWIEQPTFAAASEDDKP